jgi:putative transcriptional regulator
LVSDCFSAADSMWHTRFSSHTPHSSMLKPQRCGCGEMLTKQKRTQEQLAHLVGVRPETILFLEKGKHNPSLKLAHDIAKVLGAKIEDIFIFDEE